MAIRRFNYTGRKKLKREHTIVYVRPSGNGLTEFDAQLSLSAYDLPRGAPVYIEAYRQTSWMRFPCGTVEQVVLPSDRTLSEFDAPEGVLFRVKVTSPSDPEGLLLAEADQVRPKEPEDTDQSRISLLPVKPDDDLGDQVYRIDLTDRPLLLINSGIGDWRAVARDPVFISLVYPAAMRTILVYILKIERHFDTEDMTSWKSQWLYYAEHLPGIDDVPTEDQSERIDDWIDEAISSFCRQNRITHMFGQYWTEEGVS